MPTPDPNQSSSRGRAAATGRLGKEGNLLARDEGLVAALQSPCSSFFMPAPTGVGPLAHLFSAERGKGGRRIPQTVHAIAYTQPSPKSSSIRMAVAIGDGQHESFMVQESLPMHV